MPCLLSYFVFEFLHRVLSTSTSRPFLPAAKQSGPRTVRVVAVVDYFEVMTSKVKVNSFFCSPNQPRRVYIVVHNVVLVSAMFALRFVPRGVVKKGVISRKRGIPCNVPCKMVYHDIHHVLCPAMFMYTPLLGPY